MTHMLYSPPNSLMIGTAFQSRFVTKYIACRCHYLTSLTMAGFWKTNMLAVNWKALINRMKSMMRWPLI